MIKRSLTIAVTVLGMILGLALPASATNNPGSCTLSGGTVKMNVKEQPGEGEVDYVSLASPVRLNVGQEPEGSTRAWIYSSGDYSEPILGAYAYSAPVDGDGYWNYRIDFRWRTAGEEQFQVEHVWVHPEQYGSNSQCSDNIYI